MKPQFLERETSRKFFKEKLNFSLKDKFLVGSIGRLDYPKNFEFLIKVFPKILKIKENSILVIIGEGKERKKLENLIEKLNSKEKIFLIGKIKESSKYLKGFDLFVLPSRYEGHSITLIEALFAKIPILASDVGGNKEILGKNCVFQLNNEKDFLEKFKKLPFPSKNPEDFSIEKTIENYIKIYFKFSK